MQRQTNDPKSLSGRREFLKSAGGAAAGLYLAGADSLASGAGARHPGQEGDSGAAAAAPRRSPRRCKPFTRWPRFGDEEEKEIVAYLRDPDYFYGTYGSIVEFEKAWLEFHQGPLLQDLLQRHGLADGDAVRVGLAARQRDPGARRQHLVPRGADAVLRAGSRVGGRQPANAQHRRRGLQAAADQEHQGHHAGALVRSALRHGSHLRLRQGARAGSRGRRQPCARRHAQGPAHGHLGPHVGLQPASEQAAAGHRSRHRDVPEPAGLRAGGVPTGIGMPRSSAPKTARIASTIPRGWGCKLRIHPIAAILAKIQLKHLAERNAAGVAQVKRLNDRLTQLPGLSAPLCPARLPAGLLQPQLPLLRRRPRRACRVKRASKR